MEALLAGEPGRTEALWQRLLAIVRALPPALATAAMPDAAATSAAKVLLEQCNELGACPPPPSPAPQICAACAPACCEAPSTSKNLPFTIELSHIIYIQCLSAELYCGAQGRTMCV